MVMLLSSGMLFDFLYDSNQHADVPSCDLVLEKSLSFKNKTERMSKAERHKKVSEIFVESLLFVRSCQRLS
jgi:hypothetical protein